MKKIYLGATLLVGCLAMAQTSPGKVGVNTETPAATLEIQPNTANAATSATTKEGILIPRVTRLRAANMGTDVVESTMVYISDATDGAASGTTVDVDAKGFYYFDGTKWVKMNAGGSAEAPKTILVKSAITTADWANGQYALVTTTTSPIQLPDSTTNQNRIISVVNQAGTTVTYAAPSPLNNSSVRAGKGHILMSDGTNWQVIGGF